MARGKGKKDLSFSSHTPERQLTCSSGWCMTKDHEGCQYQFDHGKCGCTCHTQTPKTQVVRENVAFIADSNDPRPWRTEE
jgi:hypothetical protein